MSCENVTDQSLLWQFEIRNGNEGVMSITDPLLDTEARAEERAMSEFLKNSFAHNPVNFSTYVTTHILNKIIKVGGLNYLVKGLTISIDKVKVVVKVQGVRYD